MMAKSDNSRPKSDITDDHRIIEWWSIIKAWGTIRFIRPIIITWVDSRLNNTPLESRNNVRDKLAKADTAHFVLRSCAAVWHTDGCQEFMKWRNSLQKADPSTLLVSKYEAKNYLNSFYIPEGTLSPIQQICYCWYFCKKQIALRCRRPLFPFLHNSKIFSCQRTSCLVSVRKNFRGNHFKRHGLPLLISLESLTWLFFLYFYLLFF